jgi:hypothetical protein
VSERASDRASERATERATDRPTDHYATEFERRGTQQRDNLQDMQVNL